MRSKPCSKHSSSRRAGGADEAVGTAERRGDEADHGCTDNAGQRAEGCVARGDGRVYRDPEGNRCRQCYEHGSQRTPEIAWDMFASKQWLQAGRNACLHLDAYLLSWCLSNSGE